MSVTYYRMMGITPHRADQFAFIHFAERPLDATERRPDRGDPQGARGGDDRQRRHRHRGSMIPITVTITMKGDRLGEPSFVSRHRHWWLPWQPIWAHMRCEVPMKAIVKIQLGFRGRASAPTETAAQ